MTVREDRRQLKKRMKTMLTFLPNMVRLCGRLMTDGRVPKTEKALFESAIIYALAPLDFLPDFIPFIGQIDDAYLVALTLLRLINRTDEGIVREHWKGGGDIVLLAQSFAMSAPLLLPKGVSRVISSKIELAPPLKTLKSTLKGKTPAALVDKPDDEKKLLLRAG
ncbi:MAG: DUF1232 domain-containing protein [Pyrinomonadaceae bacterium]|nr:DUF1232 domain-containing protein [Pyrinomonadaceae bacterium]